jgi:molecular chaperone DnaK (HSP70)
MYCTTHLRSCADESLTCPPCPPTAAATQEEGSPALSIILEPEAAALATRRAADDAGGPRALVEGETFMVVDAGGGTVDITVHKVSGSQLLRV